MSRGRGINGLCGNACGFMPRKPLYLLYFGGYLCCKIMTVIQGFKTLLKNVKMCITNILQSK
jgi:hypothetical protein